MLKLVLKLALLILIATASYAQPGRDWVMLGQSHVDGAVDHDRIVITGARGEFRALRIRVENSAIRFDRVLVHFGDGSTMPIGIRGRINAGGQTRILDLPGRRRVIDSVEFWYERGNWRNPARPRLSLFGLR